MTISSNAMDTDLDHKPRHIAYLKMEQLIQLMQLSGTGVPLKNQRSFRSVIPAVFTGEDFIVWLMQHVGMEEEEAQHLAMLLCHCGYIFPVTDTKILTVKFDNSLYRFQTPLYWPSQKFNADNLMYAIYLTKRSMRNKQKHGLEEHEQTALNKLKEMLCNKEDYIMSQAKEEVRNAKERKRSDKVVVDSQERAFWRIQRPAPGQMKYTEEGPKRNFQPSQIEARRCRKDILSKKVQVLRKSFAMHRVKTSQALETYTLRALKYHDYDPMFQPVQPSNPWISDDKGFWGRDDVDPADFLTERQVRMWSLSFRDLLSDRQGLAEFTNFLNREYSQENLHFWKVCEYLKFAPVSEVPDMINKIHSKFLTPGSLHEVNVDSKTSQEVLNNIRSGKEGKPSRFTFLPAENHIFLLMKKDSYPRFLRSEIYKQFLSSALQPDGKKKFFNFGSRKKMLTPSPKPKRRGSSNSGDAETEGVIGSAHHSYSTGNLQELDDKTVFLRRDVNSSDSSLTRCDTSPSMSRRQDRSSSARETSPRKSRQQQQLEVPKHMSLNLDGSQRGEPSSCLALAVPSKTNVVAPWEGSE